MDTTVDDLKLILVILAFMT